MDAPPPSPRALLQRLEGLQTAGVSHLPKKVGVVREAAPQEAAVAAVPGPPTVDPASRGRRPSEAAVPALPSPAAPKSASSGKPESPPPTVDANVAPTLEVLQQSVAACTACQELASTRTQTVFGVGNPRARLCFMGEAPGADEDRLGEPFVGPAGQLLTKMLGACHLSRDDVYILNTLKCRPPGNRNPTPDESRACRPFLQRQLELIDPEYICCLGAVAAQNFLETTTPIGRLRGKVHEHAGRKVVCTYHPAYLLRNPSAKKPAWDDLQMLMAQMGTPV